MAVAGFKVTVIIRLGPGGRGDEGRESSVGREGGAGEGEEGGGKGGQHRCLLIMLGTPPGQQFKHGNGKGSDIF